MAAKDSARNGSDGAQLSDPSRLLEIEELILAVWTEVRNGIDENVQAIEQAHDEGTVLLGEKRYVSEINAEFETKVFLEKDGIRTELKSDRGDCAWGYRGRGPLNTANAIFSDCFGKEDLPLALQCDVLRNLYDLVTSKNGAKPFVIYEHEVRACVPPADEPPPKSR